MQQIRRSFYASTLVSMAVALMASGCSSGDGGEEAAGGMAPSSDALSAFEGIYELSSWTENDAGCDGIGDDVTAAALEPLFVLVPTSILGQNVLIMASCADEQACRDTASAIGSMQSYSYEYGATLSEQQGADVLSGFSAWTGTERDGMCAEREFDDHTLTRTGDTVRLETRVKALPDQPPEDGFCVAEPAKDRQEAKGAPCVFSSVIEGARIADL